MFDALQNNEHWLLYLYVSFYCTLQVLNVFLWTDIFSQPLHQASWLAPFADHFMHLGPISIEIKYFQIKVSTLLFFLFTPNAISNFLDYSKVNFYMHLESKMFVQLPLLQLFVIKSKISPSYVSVEEAGLINPEANRVIS